MPIENLTAAQKSAIDDLFAPWSRTDRPGAVAAVFRDGDILYEAGYGMSNLEHGVPNAPESIFHIASISKQFTAACLLLLEDDGLLSLEDDIRTFIPELPNYGAPITLRQMMNHTSGLRYDWFLLALAGWRDDDPRYFEDQFEIICRQKNLTFPPGTEYSYSNTGYSLQDTVVRRVTGRTLREFAQARIFNPLGMYDTHFHDDHSEPVKGRTAAYAQRGDGRYRIDLPLSQTVGAGGVHTTIRDFARWDENYASPKIGGPDFVERMRTPGLLRHGVEIGYGLGLVVQPYRSQPAFGHSGGEAGYRTFYLRLPEHHLSVAVFANTPDVAPHVRTDEIMEICLGDALPPIRVPDPGTPTIEALERRAGLYRSPRTGELLRLTVADGGLVSGFSATRPLPSIASNVHLYDEGFPTFVYDFDDDRRTMTLRDLTTVETDPPEYRKIEPVEPDAESLAELAGEYVSEELGVTWRIHVGDGEIIVARRKLRDEAYLPADKDTFGRDAGQISFTRTPGGEVDGFSFGNGWIRNLRFDRLGKSMHA